MTENSTGLAAAEKAGAEELSRQLKETEAAQAALRASEERLRALVDSTIDGIIVIDEAGTIESFNRSAERIFGYASVEVVGQNVSTLMPEPDRGQHDAYIGRYHLTGEAKIIGIGREVTGLRKDGSTFPLDLGISEIRVGELRSFTGLVRDITDRKRAEQELQRVSEDLRRSEERITAIVENVFEGIVTIDSTGIIQWRNRAASEIFGYDPEEITGQNIKILMPEPFKSEHDTYLQRYLKNGAGKNYRHGPGGRGAPP